jgi:hypothetical protein
MPNKQPCTFAPENALIKPYLTFLCIVSPSEKTKSLTTPVVRGIDETQWRRDVLCRQPIPVLCASRKMRHNAAFKFKPRPATKVVIYFGPLASVLSSASLTLKRIGFVFRAFANSDRYAYRLYFCAGREKDGHYLCHRIESMVIPFSNVHVFPEE